MLIKGEHLEGVEPINEKLFENKKFLKIINEKLNNKEAIIYIKSIVNERDVYDKSGYSGSSTVIVKKDENNKNEYVIKIQPKNNLKKEFIAYKYFYKEGLTSKPIKYFDCGKYEVMIVEKINYPTAGFYFNNYKEISEFFGKELRKFHDKDFVNGKFSKEEYKTFKEKYKKSYKKAINNNSCLKYLSIYMEDYDWISMQKYLKKHKQILFDDIVLVHGDFNPNNIFIQNGNIKLIDFKDSGFVDRHYDIFWTMFMIIIFSGILKEKEKTRECEKIFLDAYGRDLINLEKIKFFKYFACLYWQQHDELTRIDIV